MADATWPTTVPEEPENDDYDETFLPNEASFQPDVGPPTSWRRSTLDGGQISASIIMTTAERDFFKTFYRTTLKDGTRPFVWNNPAYSSAGRYKFAPSSPPRVSAIGAGLWRVRLSLIRLS